MLNGLSLFSGIGGSELALREWVKPVAYCEIDPYAAGVLFSRMLDGAIPKAPIFPDIRHLSAGILPAVDIIYGGFPCQDLSVAGKKAGLEGKRSGLFFEAIRLVSECKPSFVFLENVPGVKKFVPRIRGEFEALGYDCRDGFLSAAEVGANHIRNRWFLLAYAQSERERRSVRDIRQADGRSVREVLQQSNGSSEGILAHAKTADFQFSRLEGYFSEPGQPEITEPRFGDTQASNTNQERLSKPQPQEGSQGVPAGVRTCTPASCWWQTEPNVGRVVDGLPARVDRIKCLGNSVVPLCAKEAFEILCGGKIK